MRVAFYGCGNIAQSIIEGLIEDGFKSEDIFYVDRNKGNKRRLKKLKINNLDDNKVSIDIFFLAVKPKDAMLAYEKIIKSYSNPKIVSLVAGINSKSYLKRGNNIEFLRAMPNTSSKYNSGITAILNSTFKENNLKKVVKLFKRVGIVLELNKESNMDKFTGFIGSGPAYFFYLLKTYEKNLNKLSNGDSLKSKEIIASLLNGVALSIKNGGSMDELIKIVASKKGTTEAGINLYKSKKLLNIFDYGIKSAIKRSKEISNEYK